MPPTLFPAPIAVADPSPSLLAAISRKMQRRIWRYLQEIPLRGTRSFPLHPDPDHTARPHPSDPGTVLSRHVLLRAIPKSSPDPILRPGLDTPFPQSQWVRRNAMIPQPRRRWMSPALRMPSSRAARQWLPASDNRKRALPAMSFRLEPRDDCVIPPPSTNRDPAFARVDSSARRYLRPNPAPSQFRRVPTRARPRDVRSPTNSPGVRVRLGRQQPSAPLDAMPAAKDRGVMPEPHRLRQPLSAYAANLYGLAPARLRASSMQHRAMPILHSPKWNQFPDVGCGIGPLHQDARSCPGLAAPRNPTPNFAQPNPVYDAALPMHPKMYWPPRNLLGRHFPSRRSPMKTSRMPISPGPSCIDANSKLQRPSDALLWPDVPGSLRLSSRRPARLPSGIPHAMVCQPVSTQSGWQLPQNRKHRMQPM